MNTASISLCTKLDTNKYTSTKKFYTQKKHKRKLIELN